MADTEQQELQQLLQVETPRSGRIHHPPEIAPSSPKDSDKDSQEHCQWEVLPNGVFMATGTTKPRLVPGAYTAGMTDGGRVLFIAKKILTDSLIDFDDSNSLRIIEGIRKFWTKREQYRSRGILYKRGVLVWGPAGSGKTATFSLLVKDLINMGGIVLLVQQPSLATRALPVLRRIEPDRPLIIVLEDVEEMIHHHGEHDLLALLDGEHQTENVCALASTNYPEALGTRIVNRPSRFDEVWKIGFPSATMREQYLVHLLAEDVTKHAVAQWVRDTKDMSIAHLKELVVAVTCLDQEYSQVIERLKSMKTTPKSQMYDGGLGFATTVNSRVNISSQAGKMNDTR